MNAHIPTQKELDALEYKLGRQRLAHMLMGLRVKNNPDKLHYHEVVAEDCRLRIEYIRGIKS